jgi:hypothetical protein
MVYSLAYRRPERVSRPSSRDSINGNEKQRSIDESIKSSSSGMSHGIPDALSFDRIISGGTCPVSSISSVMTLSKHVNLCSPAPPVTL